MKASKRPSRKPRHGDEWFTLPETIASLGPFDLDPACGPLCPNQTANQMLRQHGLEAPWTGRIFLNPPFSKAAPWLQRLAEHGDGIALTFIRWEAMWFQEIIQRSGFLFAFKRRQKFGRPGGNITQCPLACCLIPFGSDNIRAIENSRLEGVLFRVPNHKS